MACTVGQHLQGCFQLVPLSRQLLVVQERVLLPEAVSTQVARQIIKPWVSTRTACTSQCALSHPEVST